MLKQVFDKNNLSKILTSSDVWKWNLLNHGTVENAMSNILINWEKNSLQLLPLKKTLLKSKATFQSARVEDDLSIRLVDRFIRRIYKIRQADRNRIIRQLLALLKDSGNYHILRLDIKNCYESIDLNQLIQNLEGDMILAPDCIKLLHNMHDDLIMNHGVSGLPRGISVSSTLAELYLEKLDKKIASHKDIIYSARYIDDIIVIFPGHQTDKVKETTRSIISLINTMGLNINTDSNKYYSHNSKNAEFNYLGYFIQVTANNNKENIISVTISQSKINKIKSRIMKSFIDYKVNQNIQLLKRRLEYISMLKVVKKGKNGNLLGGIAQNYQFVTDDFECLKDVNNFVHQQKHNPRFNMSSNNKKTIDKMSIYSDVKYKKIGNFTKSQTIQIMRIWKNA